MNTSTAADEHSGADAGFDADDHGHSSGDGSSSGGGGGGSSSNTDTTRDMPDQICRDFLRDVCRRGLRCRFKHPQKEEVAQLGIKKPEYQFCHDYQNQMCKRASCRFVHCSRDEEEYFNTHGELPPRLQNVISIGAPLNDPLCVEYDLPACKDYLMKRCERGNSCKYRHLSLAEYEIDIERKLKRKAAQQFGQMPFQPNVGAMPGGDGKRLRMDEMAPAGMAFGAMQSRAVMAAPSPKALEENAFLKERMAEIEKQIDALQTSNNLLMQQNARLRSVSGQSSGGQSSMSAPVW